MENEYGIIAAVIAGAVMGLLGFVKSIFSGTAVKNVQNSQNESMQSIETWKREQELKIEQCEKRLDEGAVQFKEVISELRKNTDSINKLDGSLNERNKMMDALYNALMKKLC